MRLAHTARSGESALEGGLASSREIVAGGGRESGGASRDRTGDLLVANQTLSQLSYGPSSTGENRRDDFRETLHGFRGPRERPWARCAVATLVGLGGVAPPTSPLSGVRSN